MNFQEGKLYHIYNRGNNKQPIFFSDANYLFFLKKVRKHILPFCDILNYCLMPNHFHFLIYSSRQTIQKTKIGHQEKNVLSEGFRNMLSSYSQAINKQNKTTGSLFQQNTRAKCLNEGSMNYGTTCFIYIHQNPWKAGLVTKLENWPFSSFTDFSGLRAGTLCNKLLATQLLNIKLENFYEDAYKILSADSLKYI